MLPFWAMTWNQLHNPDKVDGMSERLHADEIARRAAWSQAQSLRRREETRERDERRRKINRLIRAKVVGVPLWVLLTADLAVGATLLVEWLA